MSKNVTKITEDLVLPIIEQKGLELVDVEFKKEGSQWFLRVFIDKEGGVDIEDCSQISEAISPILDEHDPITQPYFLEVSSPGAERPLKREQDVQAAIGKSIYVKLYEPLEGQKEFEGLLQAFDGATLTIEIKQKTRVKVVHIPYQKVANARLAIVF